MALNKVEMVDQVETVVVVIVEVEVVGVVGVVVESEVAAATLALIKQEMREKQGIGEKMEQTSAMQGAFVFFSCFFFCC